MCRPLPFPPPAWAHPPSPLWQILRQHYSPESVRLFNEAIDEVQNVPVTFEAYSELGLAPGGAPGEPWRDPAHAAWHGRNLLGPEARPQNRVDNIICGTDKLDSIVRDHKMKEIHKVTAPSAFPRCANVAHTPLAGAVAQELAGGACMLSATYYIERHGPCDAGGLHHGGFPKMRTFRTYSPLVPASSLSQSRGALKGRWRAQTTVSITRPASLPATRRRRRSSSLTCPRWPMAVRIPTIAGIPTPSILTPSILTVTS